MTDEQLKKLSDDLHDMQDFLDKQVRRMDAVIDEIEIGWRGPTARTYRRFHRAVAEDAVRIREVMELIEEAVRMSRGGFTELELDTLERLRQIQVGVNVSAEAAELSTPAPEAHPRSSFDKF
ncbi:WXG100 family type VII secretion target [Streptomyces niveus]|uniref:WXG100 family type VII secretion target n=1 Tax=Streptomyces niveus TaxID=193462 RepID=UPI0036C696A7